MGLELFSFAIECFPFVSGDGSSFGGCEGGGGDHSRFILFVACFGFMGGKGDGDGGDGGGDDLCCLAAIKALISSSTIDNAVFLPRWPRKSA